MNDTTNDPWPTADENTLRSLFAEGNSYGLIAQKMEGRYSRSACISKVKRLKLTRECAEGTIRKAPTNGNAKRRHQAVVRIAESLATPLIDDIDIPEAQRRSILELSEEVCHFPIGNPGEPGFAFCGGPVADGSAYCRAHHIRCYQRGSAIHRPEANPPARSWMMAEAK